MSGRTRWVRDGELVTGYRKTDRRQNQTSPHDRLARLALRGAREDAHFPVRMAFVLPRTIAGFVGAGEHGPGVSVLKGFVRICGLSSEQCFSKAAAFFRDVARDRPAFTITPVVVLRADPTAEELPRCYPVHVTVVRGAMIVSGGSWAPKVFEAA